MLVLCQNRRKIKPTNIQLDHSSVINLSSYSLSTDETSVLARGLTFCPTPRHIDWPEVSADIYDFSRRMRLTEYFFDDNSKTSNSNEDDTPFHNKSTWNSPNGREGWFGQPKYSTFLKKSHSTLYRSLLSLSSFIFIKPIRSTFDPTYTCRIIVHGCLLGHYIIWQRER